MRKLIFVLALVFAVNAGMAQQNWNMLNYNGYITKAAFCNAYTGWAVGYGGIIFKSTNSGVNWVQQFNPEPGRSLDQITAFTPDVCIVSGNTSNKLLKTTNGGTDWFVLYDFGGHIYSGSIESHSFINQNTGWVLSDSMIYKTTNGGGNWSLQSTLNSLFRDIVFTDDNTGYAKVDYSSNILKTTNGGLSWNTLPIPASNLNCMQFKNSLTGYMTGSISGIGKLLKTTNGGYNWEVIYQQTSWVDLMYVTNTTAFAIDYNYGKVFKSSNGGYNWNQVYTDSTQFTSPNWIYAYDTLNVFFGTYDLRLAKSSNGGLNFINVISSNYPEYEYINDCKFFNNTTGYYYSNNYLIKTTNQGESFTSISYRTNISNSPRNVNFTDQNTGYYVYGDTVIKTTNGGNNWFTTGQFNDVLLKSLEFINNNTGWVVGCWFNHVVYYFDLFLAKTTNGGQNWETHIGFNGLTLGMIEGIHFLDANTGWCRARNENGSPTYIAKTTNGGTNFTSILYINNTDGNEVLLNANTGYVASANKIYKTTNGGSNWTQNVYDVYTKFFDIFFVNNSTGWVCGDNGVLYKTTNEGIDWVKINTGLNTPFKCVKFINENTGFITGDGGTIMKTTNGGSVFISQTQTEIPSSFRLEQNYPNPFNSSSKFKFKISKLGDVKIIVYDVQGREVQTLVNERMNAGTYEVRFDGSGLTSGVYFYRMEAGNFTETKRMILTK